MEVGCNAACKGSIKQSRQVKAALLYIVHPELNVKKEN